MSDIAERLKNFKERYDTSIDFPSKCRIAEELGGYTLDNMPAIISALQFAEDMQVIAKASDGLVRAEVWHSSPDRVPAVFIWHNFKHYEGLDIFTAARNAVEQMEGSDA